MTLGEKKSLQTERAFCLAVSVCALKAWAFPGFLQSLFLINFQGRIPAFTGWHLGPQPPSTRKRSIYARCFSRIPPFPKLVPPNPVVLYTSLSSLSCTLYLPALFVHLGFFFFFLTVQGGEPRAWCSPCTPLPLSSTFSLSTLGAFWRPSFQEVSGYLNTTQLQRVYALPCAQPPYYQ